MMTQKTSLFGSISATFFKILIIGFFGLIILFPFYYMISGSLMSFDEINDNAHTHLAPSTPHWENFTSAFADGYWKSLLLTAVVTLLTIVLKIFITMLMGYAFSLPKWRGKKFFWWLFLMVMMLPEVALLSGQFTVVTKMQMREGMMVIPALIMPFLASVFTAFMFRNAFEAIPSRIKEASYVDNVSGARYFFKVAVPMVTPTIWTVGIITAFAAWNSYMWPSVLLQDPDGNQLISTWLFTTGKAPDPEAQQGLWINIRLAAALLAILPMFIIYLVMRKRIMNAVGKQGSAIKG